MGRLACLRRFSPPDVVTVCRRTLNREMRRVIQSHDKKGRGGCSRYIAAARHYRVLSRWYSVTVKLYTLWVLVYVNLKCSNTHAL